MFSLAQIVCSVQVPELHVYLLAGNSEVLKDQRRQFERAVHVDAIRIVDEQCSCHEVVASSMSELKVRIVVSG